MREVFEKRGTAGAVPRAVAHGISQEAIAQFAEAHGRPAGKSGGQCGKKKRREQAVPGQSTAGESGYTKAYAKPGEREGYSRVDWELLPDGLRTLAVGKGKLFSAASRAHRLLLEGNFSVGRQVETPAEKRGANTALAAVVVGNMDEITRIYRELDHYKATGRILGEHPVFRSREQEVDAAQMSDAQLVKRARNLPADIRKYRRERIPRAGDTVRRAKLEERAARWEALLAAVRKEIKKRKI